MADTGISYSEIMILESRKADRLVKDIYMLGIKRHGKPTALLADDEFNLAPIREALQARPIKFRPRMSRLQNKCGIIERKNGTIKRLLERLNKADSG